MLFSALWLSFHVYKLIMVAKSGKSFETWRGKMALLFSNWSWNLLRSWEFRSIETITSDRRLWLSFYRDRGFFNLSWKTVVRDHAGQPGLLWHWAYCVALHQQVWRLYRDGIRTEPQDSAGSAKQGESRVTRGIYLSDCTGMGRCCSG